LTLHARPLTIAGRTSVLQMRPDGRADASRQVIRAALLASAILLRLAEDG